MFAPSSPRPEASPAPQPAFLSGDEHRARLGGDLRRLVEWLEGADTLGPTEQMHAVAQRLQAVARMLHGIPATAALLEHTERVNAALQSLPQCRVLEFDPRASSLGRSAGRIVDNPQSPETRAELSPRVRVALRRTAGGHLTTYVLGSVSVPRRSARLSTRVGLRREAGC